MPLSAAARFRRSIPDLGLGPVLDNALVHRRGLGPLMVLAAQTILRKGVRGPRYRPAEARARTIRRVVRRRADPRQSADLASLVRVPFCRSKCRAV